MSATEILVPYDPRNSLIANKCVLLAEKPLDYGFKHELLGDIQAFIHAYVDLSPAFEAVAAHYVLLSWIYDRFREIPYLRFQGEYGSGKTRALTAVGSICYKPFFASGASTVSPIFHTLNAFRGTLVLDEADLPFSDARVELVKILNNGHARGMPVLRSMQNRHKEFNPTAFQVYGPKLIAMRTSFQDQALESRFLTEEMGHRRMRAGIPTQLPPQFHSEAEALRNRLLHYRITEWSKILPNLDCTLMQLEPRLNQIALPLLNVMDDLDAQHSLRNLLVRQQERLVADRREAPEADVISAALVVLSVPQGLGASVGDITARLNVMLSASKKPRRSSKWVGYVLRTKLGIATRRHAGQYIIAQSEKARLEALAQRYGILGSGQ